MPSLLYAVFGILLIQDICFDVVSCDSYHVGVTFKNTERGYVGVKMRARRVDLPTIHIETVVILDEDYIRYLNYLGHTTEELMTETIRLKWNGVQAEFGKAAGFGYHIYIDIKLIEFWHTNPEWYQPTSRLDATLHSVCFGAEQQGLYLAYDFIHLYTGIETTDVSWKHYTGRICDPQRKCAVSAIADAIRYTRVTVYVISTHELGHSLGMSHDSDVGCPSPNDGIMGSKTSGWSECSIKATRELLQGQTVGCLFETNVDKDTVIALTEAWPDTGVTVGENCTNTFCRDAYAICDAEKRCTCKTGYGYNTRHCADTDECFEGVPVCVDTTSGGHCSNTEGSFVCSCIEGFTGDGYSGCEGVLNRTCSDTEIWGSVENGCILDEEAVNTLFNKLDNLFTTTTPSHTGEWTTPFPVKNLTELVEILDDIIKVVDNGKKLQQINLENTVRLQDMILTRVEDTGKAEEAVLESFAKSLDALLDPEVDGTWTAINSDQASPVKPSWILDMTNRYIEVIQNQRCSNRNISKKFMYIAIKEKGGDIEFPSSEAQQLTTSIDIGSADITIPLETLRKKGLNGHLCAGGSYFTTLGQTLEKTKYDNGTIVDFDGVQVVNSDVISMRINVDVSLTELDPRLTIKIKPKVEGYGKPLCVYWDFNLTLPGSSSRGAWSGRGCQLISHSSSEVVCLCDHLTNFAVLMSPKAVVVAKVLNMISAVGCGISIFCLLMTIICHMVVWRLVRSDRTTMLMNLCIALLLALVTFMVGVDRVESRTACAVIAAIIQFLFLAVFFIMFLMGVEILICVVHVFDTKFRIKVLLPLMWGAAALVVAVSLGVTKAEGYGNDKFCWLDTESGLIWAFIGPVAFVIFANFIIMAVVFQKMSSSTVLKSKTAKEKAKTTARSLCVLLPLMGVTWVFGLLAVNRDTGYFAYIFCIVNSLQGLFIFLFHCVFNRQIKNALKHTQAKKRSLQTVSSELRKRSATQINKIETPSPDKKKHVRKNSLPHHHKEVN